MRVLIVEDETMVGATLADIVEEFGGKVTGVVSSGLASVGAASDNLPDVIIMDVALPGMDGIDAGAIIRARYGIPIVFVSGRVTRAEVAARLGDLIGIEILTKPWARARSSTRFIGLEPG
jgi:DNA-binding response OmpR family regulator